MAFISLFEVIGPNMVGPSSSHTAGAALWLFWLENYFQERLQK